LRCLFSSIDFGDAHTVKNNSLQAKLLSSELSSILNKTSFVSSICFAIENPFHYQKVSHNLIILKICFKYFFLDTQTDTTSNKSNIKSSQLFANPRNIVGNRIKKFYQFRSCEIRRAALENLFTSTYTELYR
jgi:hypothetical protein